MTTRPLVTIGLPVYNEGRFLRPAVESLLAQDYPNFELIISDNASTDETSGICREYAAKDSRIRYRRNEVNVGSFENFNRLCKEAGGKYFMWAAGHDMWRPAFISRCIEPLEKDTSVVLAYPIITWIDAEGRILNGEPSRFDTRGMGVSSRLNCVIWGLNKCDFIYGLIRREALNHSKLFRPTLSPDNIIIAELSLVGAIAFVPEPLYEQRCFRDHKNYADAVNHLTGYHVGDRKLLLVFPSWRFLGAHLLAVMRAPVKLSRKPVLLASALFGILCRRSKHMVHDLKLAARRLVGMG